MPRHCNKFCKHKASLLQDLYFREFTILMAFKGWRQDKLLYLKKIKNAKILQEKKVVIHIYFESTNQGKRVWTKLEKSKNFASKECK